MSQVAIAGNLLGAGILTIAAPNTASSYTLTLPQINGTIVSSDINGIVGIGTSSPPTNSMLAIKSNYSGGDGMIRLIPRNATEETSIGFYTDTAGTNQATRWVVGCGSWASPYVFQIGYGSGPTFSITTATDVGIGTTNNTTYGSDVVIHRGATRGAGGNDTRLAISNINTANASAIRFYNSATSYLTGEIAVGGPGYPSWGGAFSFNINAVQGGPIVFNKGGTTPGSSGGATELMRITATGGLGIGTTTDPGAGAIYATGNITAFYSSDAKFKENIQPITGACEIIRAIGGDYFNWNDEYIAKFGGADGYFLQKEDFGVIAQKVQRVFPKAVRTRPDGTLAVDYEKLGILAFPAIIEILDRLDTLEAKVGP
jgi:hypothetical protein